ncbi:MAG: carbohydrate ABC transporter permease, partial [Armatimonadota bacterium]|nr:carbohydrate ABC transporter permease [Armatimonadota bacterium]
VESQYEKNTFDLIPRYLHSDTALFGKYAEDKYRGDITLINATYGTNYAALQDVMPPVNMVSARDWGQFAAALPLRYKMAGFGGAAAAFSPSPLLDRYHQFLRVHFHGDIHALDRAYAQEDEDFQTVFPPFEQPTKHSWTADNGVKSRDWQEFEASLPANYFIVVGADPIYQTWLKEEAYPDLDALNKAWGTSVKAYEFMLPARPEGNAAERRDWETFVRTKLPFRDVIVAPSALTDYQAFLQTRYKGSIADYNQKYGAQALSFAALALPNPDTIPAAGPPLLDWLDFLKIAPLDALSADTPETRWHDRAGTGQPLAVQASDWAYVQAHTGALRRDYMTRNYSLVMQYVLLHGQAVWVTAIFCLLAIVTTLLVNPLCAYALSRYNLSYGNAVLLFLLATMSFPGEISLIQNFLLLKQFNLLNTYAALILPGAASGYSIFLMKGFFDSLPRELYEAGTIDGATELRMFWTITLPLSRPIFAYISFIAFTTAYGGFLYAMTICQDHRMWTVMVWLYELQSSGAPMYVMMAALTLAAVPTLLAFLLAQNVIMKGIILPSFK